MFIQMIIEDILQKTAETTRFKYTDLKLIYDKHKKLEILFNVIYIAQNYDIDIFAVSNSFSLVDGN